MSDPRDERKRWRPWQFSLRTLLTLMLAFACFFGGWTVNELRRESERGDVFVEPAGQVVTVQMQPGRWVESGEVIGRLDSGAVKWELKFEEGEPRAGSLEESTSGEEGTSSNGTQRSPY